MQNCYQRFLGGVALTALALAATPAHAATTTLHVFDFSFGTAAHVHLDPTINVGDTIEWVWDANSFKHSATSVKGMSESWDSGLFLNNHTFDHTFTNAGDFAYYCTLHGSDTGNQTATGMAGIIHVNAAPVPEPSLVIALPTLLGIGMISLRRRRAATLPPRVVSSVPEPLS